MLYRSKQRGFLELDLVLGNWVEEHIWAMDESGIRALADVLDLVRKWILRCYFILFKSLVLGLFYYMFICLTVYPCELCEWSLEAFFFLLLPLVANIVKGNTLQKLILCLAMFSFVHSNGIGCF